MDRIYKINKIESKTAELDLLILLILLILSMRFLLRSFAHFKPLLSRLSAKAPR